MKNDKANTILTIAVLSTVSYFIIDFFNTKYDRIARYAAGESLYEKTHRKKQ
jgi:hypothetical protein